MGLYPVILNMRDRLAVVIGGGEVALRKVKDLLAAEARVRVVSPMMHPGIMEMNREWDERLEVVVREYRAGDLDGAALVFSATNDPGVNRIVFGEAEERGLFINAVDDPPNCTFFVPSFVKKGDLILALSTGGASPAMAARLRRELEGHIPGNIEELLAALREARRILQEGREFAGLPAPARGSLLRRIVDDDALLEGLAASVKSGKAGDYLKGLV